ncbi:MAG TPA: LacI family DNA-binding transcriptional regulator [Opitutaceae bacterium]|nr:LacI family DNA-binding transcriptional regulator [Opitutaceae bacterium]
MPSSTKPKIPPVIRSTADFARHIGLARTTVSRVINGQPGLKQKTIDCVQRALAETGFTPNAHALHLKGKRTSMIGICMEDLATPPAVRKLSTLQRVLRSRGFSSLIEVFSPGSGREVVRHFLSLRVEGVVFIGHFHREEIEARLAELNGHGTPHVVIDHFGLKGANTVSLDRAAGMEAVVNHLLDLGHRTFGLLGVTKGPTSRIDRMSGIQAALRARGLDFNACMVSLDHLHERRNDFEYGHRLAASFLAQPMPPTAFIGHNDEIAIGAMRRFREGGLKLPRDASVTGFNNQDICHMTWPTLTTVDQSIDLTIETAAKVILSQLDQPPRTKPLVKTIPPQLIVGESTGPAK